MRTTKERFYEKIALPDENGCMKWRGRPTSNGYGQFCAGSKRTQAHRTAYELLVGPIPNGLIIDHVYARGCRSKLCCAPDHLEPVTHAENVRRGRTGEVARARHAHITHCPRGHEYTPNNLLRLTGPRSCKVCTRGYEARMKVENPSKYLEIQARKRAYRLRKKLENQHEEGAR